MVTVRIVAERQRPAGGNVTKPQFLELEVRSEGNILQPWRIVEDRNHPYGLLDVGCVQSQGCFQQAFIPLDQTARAICEEYLAAAKRQAETVVNADRDYKQVGRSVLRNTDRYENGQNIEKISKTKHKKATS